MIEECQANEGGVLYLGSSTTTVVSDIVVKDASAQNGAAIFMEDGSQLQATHVYIHHTCHDGARSVLRLSDVAGQIPLRGFRINATACDPSVSLIEGAIDRISIPSCAQQLYADVVSGRGERICGADATCADEQIATSLNLTAPTCRCADPFYANPGAVRNAALTPYLAAGGCVSAPYATQVVVVSDRL
eukprot:3101305-Prymnesium_polylepis.1